MSEKRNVAILIFDEVEILDFAGPFEVFAVTREDDSNAPFNVFTVAEEDRPVLGRHGLSINPKYTLDTCPAPDIVLVPGGNGRRQAMTNERILNWLRDRAPQTEQLLSVCTGAHILAHAGLLDGLAATTYHTALDELENDFPTITVRRGERWVDNGHVVTSAGVSAGIDMALHVVGKLLGADVAAKTAAHMEYEYWRDEAVRA